MKKIFILASVVIIAMTSCKKDEVIVNNSLNNEIGFSTFTHKTTKATPTTGATILTLGQSIKVYSYHVQALTAGTGVTALDFFDTDLAYTATGWQSNPVYYWPTSTVTEGSRTATKSLGFFAYHPSGATGLTDWDATAYKAATSSRPSFKYTVPAASDTQQDLLVAYAENRIYTATGSNNPVPLAFAHALSKITFSAKGDDVTNTLTYEVNSVTIGNKVAGGDLKNAGTFTYNTTVTGAWSAQSGTASYTYPLSATPVSIVGTTQTVLGTASSPLMLMPQTAAADAVRITVNYSVTDATGNVFSTGNRYFDLAAFTWEKGKGYHYVITLPSGSHPITYTVTVSDWATDSDIPVTVQ